MMLGYSSHITFPQILEAQSCAHRHVGEFGRGKKKDLMLLYFSSTLWLLEVYGAIYQQMNPTNLCVCCIEMVLPIDVERMSKKQTLSPKFYPRLAFPQGGPLKNCVQSRQARHRNILLLTRALIPVTNVDLQRGGLEHAEDSCLG